MSGNIPEENIKSLVDAVKRWAGLERGGGAERERGGGEGDGGGGGGGGGGLLWLFTSHLFALFAFALFCNVDILR